jgi:polysaccharide export outer membrane protein
MSICTRLLAISLCLGCSPIGQYVWADDYREPPPASEQNYAIAPGDTIQVRVFGQDQLLTKAKVRGDGRFSMPLLGDVEAAHLSPIVLSRELEEKLKDFIKNPSVTVSLEDARPQSVYVTGEVVKPGPYPLDSAPGVLQAIVNAGGLGPLARADRIFVLRQAKPPVRIRFTYESLVHLTGKAASFRLAPGDIVVVE